MTGGQRDPAGEEQQQPGQRGGGADLGDQEVLPGRPSPGTAGLPPHRSAGGAPATLSAGQQPRDHTVRNITGVFWLHYAVHLARLPAGARGAVGMTDRVIAEILMAVVTHRRARPGDRVPDLGTGP